MRDRERESRKHELKLCEQKITCVCSNGTTEGKKLKNTRNDGKIYDTKNT